MSSSAPLTEEHPRVAEFLELLSRMAGGETHLRVPISKDRDTLDAIGFGINMLSAELAYTTISRDAMTNIINAISDLIIVVDSTGKILDANLAVTRLLGLSTDTLVGGRIENHVKSEKFSFEQIRTELKRSGFVRDLEWFFHASDGTSAPTMVNAALVSSTGETEVHVFVGRDVRETYRLLEQAAEAAVERKRGLDLKRARDTAEEASRAKSAFLAVVSHEIRTPMTVILASAQLLKITGVSEEQRAGCISRILNSGQTLIKLIEDLLDFSRIEADGVTIEHSAVAPLDILTDVISSVAPLAESKGFDIDVRSELNISESILTDPMRLKQILVNLLGNAVKFTATGKVLVTVKQVADDIVFDVVDSGIGISAEKQAQLFTPFYQVDSSISRRYGGTGLGLALSRRLTQLLGGTLELAWSHIDKGSCFRLVLPIGARATVAAPESKSSLAARHDLRGRSILIIEDNHEISLLVALVLRVAGATVRTITTGTEAVVVVASDPSAFDLVLMDLRLPGLDGVEATRQIRAGGYTGRIFAVSGDVLPETRQRALVAGCDRFIAKPVDFESMLEAITASS